jgi:hypothetical protein
MQSVTSLREILEPVPSSPPRVGFIYLGTNESLQAKTFTTLGKQPITGRAAIGVSDFFTLHAVASRTADTAEAALDTIIMIDRSTNMEKFWQEVDSIVCATQERSQAIEKIEKLVREKYKSTEFFFERDDFDGVLKRFHDDIKDGTSWLSTDEKYQRIKAIFDTKRFIFKRLELCDSPAFEILGKQLDKHGISTDFVYLSNTFEYLEKDEEKAKFFRSMQALIKPKTLVISTKPRSCKFCQTVLLQQVLRKKTDAAKVADFFPEPPPATFHLPFISHKSTTFKPVEIHISTTL